MKSLIHTQLQIVWKRQNSLCDILHNTYFVAKTYVCGLAKWLPPTECQASELRLTNMCCYSYMRNSRLALSEKKYLRALNNW